MLDELKLTDDLQNSRFLFLLITEETPLNIKGSSSWSAGLGKPLVIIDGLFERLK